MELRSRDVNVREVIDLTSPGQYSNHQVSSLEEGDLVQRRAHGVEDCDGITERVFAGGANELSRQFEARMSILTPCKQITSRGDGNTQESWWSTYNYVTPKAPGYEGVCCPICLSPLMNGKEIYTTQQCRHDFHRSCLKENRRAENTGCPCCRGFLEKGLTPSPTSSERHAIDVMMREEDQREAIRRAASRARNAVTRRNVLRSTTSVEGPVYHW
ncbi:unnamed protein product [Choristocarpus tenellus]